MTLLPEKIAQGITCCVKDDCASCPLPTQEWKNKGMVACAPFWECNAVLPKELAESAAAAIIALNKLADRKGAQVGAAYWIPENVRAKSYTWICSECRARAYDIPHGLKKDQPKRCSLKYCPNCGLPMTAKHPHSYADRDTAYPANQDVLMPAT